MVPNTEPEIEKLLKEANEAYATFKNKMSEIEAQRIAILKQGLLKADAKKMKKIQNHIFKLP